MNVDKLLGYAEMCSYSVQLVPADPARPIICVDGVNKRVMAFRARSPEIRGKNPFHAHGAPWICNT